jgi:prepilin-type N-terminal cleavage/methylation domain-containing protein
MRYAKDGFTLAELLIAIAILGVIAAFTIPKVLENARSAEAIAKIREAVATIENAYYSKKNLNVYATAGTGILYGQGLYENLNTIMNFTNGGTTNVPVSVLPATHPCAAAIGTVNIHTGWAVMPTGVVLTGLDSGPGFDSLPWDDASHDGANNYVICIDYNGSANPNLPGQDIFIGNFNQYGCFGSGGGGLGCTAGGIPTGETIKNFNWGNSTTDVVDNTGGGTVAVGGFPDGGGNTFGQATRSPNALIGSLLGQ